MLSADVGSQLRGLFNSTGSQGEPEVSRRLRNLECLCIWNLDVCVYDMLGQMLTTGTQAARNLRELACCLGATQTIASLWEMIGERPRSSDGNMKVRHQKTLWCLQL